MRLSPDGRHFVVGTAYGLLYFAWDFERVHGGMLFADLIECLSFNNFIRDLCWDPDSYRLAVRTLCPRDAQSVRTARMTLRPPLRPQVTGNVFLITPVRAQRSLRGAGADGGSPPSIAHDASAAQLYWFAEDQDYERLDAHGAPFVGMQVTQTALWFVGDVELLRDTLGAAEAGEVGNEDVDVDGNGNGDGDAIIRAGESGPDIGLLCVTELLPLRLDRR